MDNNSPKGSKPTTKPITLPLTSRVMHILKSLGVLQTPNNFICAYEPFRLVGVGPRQKGFSDCPVSAKTGTDDALPSYPSLARLPRADEDNRKGKLARFHKVNLACQASEDYVAYPKQSFSIQQVAINGALGSQRDQPPLETIHQGETDGETIPTGDEGGGTTSRHRDLKQRQPSQISSACHQVEHHQLLEWCNINFWALNKETLPRLATRVTQWSIIFSEFDYNGLTMG